MRDLLLFEGFGNVDEKRFDHTKIEDTSKRRASTRERNLMEMRCLAIATGVLLAGSMLASPVGAVTQDNFQVRNVGDLVQLCSAGPDDPLQVAAISFCDGYLLGWWRHYQ